MLKASLSCLSYCLCWRPSAFRHSIPWPFETFVVSYETNKAKAMKGHVRGELGSYAQWYKISNFVPNLKLKKISIFEKKSHKKFKICVFRHLNLRTFFAVLYHCAMKLPERKSSGKKEEENSCKQSYCHCLLVKANTIKVKKGRPIVEKGKKKYGYHSFAYSPWQKTIPFRTSWRLGSNSFQGRPDFSKVPYGSGLIFHSNFAMI